MLCYSYKLQGGIMTKLLGILKIVGFIVDIAIRVYNAVKSKNKGPKAP
jgi:regulator of RNase E activity RraA